MPHYTNAPQTFRDICKHPALLLATWFGCGLSPKAPGTVGSLGALPVVLLIHALYGNAAVMLFAVVIFGVGCWASSVYLKLYPEKPDPSAIVIDEVAGQALLISALFPTWQSYLIGFLLFRFFDVLKPWPVSWADKELKGAYGVMADDMVAACYPLFALLLATPIIMLLDKERWFSMFYTLLGS